MRRDCALAGEWMRVSRSTRMLQGACTFLSDRFHGDRRVNPVHRCGNQVVWYAETRASGVKLVKGSAVIIVQASLARCYEQGHESGLMARAT